jgi:hypothetical protein
MRAINQLFTKHEQLCLLIGILGALLRVWLVGWLDDFGETLTLLLVFVPVGLLILTDRSRLQAHK